MNIRKFCMYGFLVLAFYGCQSESLEEISQKEADQLFASAKEDMTHKKYDSAIKSLETIQLNYPQYAEYDQLLYLVSKAQFNHKDYMEAQDNAHEYIISNPMTVHTEEMRYIEAMSQYLVNDSWMSNQLLSPRHLRDTTFIKKAKSNFLDFKKSYPKSKYLKEVNQSLAQIEDILASEDLEIAQYNYNHKAYLGAIHRAEEVIKHYPKTKQYQAALKIMDDSFYQLGLMDEYQELKNKIEHSKA